MFFYYTINASQTLIFFHLIAHKLSNFFSSWCITHKLSKIWYLYYLIIEYKPLLFCINKCWSFYISPIIYHVYTLFLYFFSFFFVSMSSLSPNPSRIVQFFIFFHLSRTSFYFSLYIFFHLFHYYSLFLFPSHRCVHLSRVK